VAYGGSTAREPELSRFGFSGLVGCDPIVGTVPSPRSRDTQVKTHERTQPFASVRINIT
jgi:hypothetical protein